MSADSCRCAALRRQRVWHILLLLCAGLCRLDLYSTPIKHTFIHLHTTHVHTYLHTHSRSVSRTEAGRLGTSHGGDAARRQQLRSALARKLLNKYHPGIANSKTEAVINQQVDRLMSISKVTEQDLHDVEALVRQQSNEEIAWITTNPFKRVTAFKSGATDEWAMVLTLLSLLVQTYKY